MSVPAVRALGQEPVTLVETGVCVGLGRGVLVLLLLVTGGVGVVVGDDLDAAAVGVRVLLGKQVLESHEGVLSVEVGGLEDDRHRVAGQHGRQQNRDHEGGQQFRLEHRRQHRDLRR